MNRPSEDGGAWLASLEVNRPSRWRRGVALAALTAAIFAGATFADDDSSRAGNGPGPEANGPGPGCNLIPPRGLDRNESRHFTVSSAPRFSHGPGACRACPAAAIR